MSRSKLYLFWAPRFRKWRTKLHRFWVRHSPIWRIKRFYRLVALAFGPGLFLVFSAWQTRLIGGYFADLGWHWCPAWPLAAVIGFTPFLGPLAAAKVAAHVGWMGFWTATVFFLAPFWLFWLLTRLPIVFGPPARRALRLVRAPRPRRGGPSSAPAGVR
jgi:hypothetical protein